MVNNGLVNKGLQNLKVRKRRERPSMRKEISLLDIMALRLDAIIKVSRL